MKLGKKHLLIRKSGFCSCAVSHMLTPDSYPIYHNMRPLERNPQKVRPPESLAESEGFNIDRFVS